MPFACNSGKLIGLVKLVEYLQVANIRFVLAEKVRVVVRCRPAHGVETSGAVQLDPEAGQVTLQRE